MTTGRSRYIDSDADGDDGGNSSVIWSPDLELCILLGSCDIVVTLCIMNCDHRNTQTHKDFLCLSLESFKIVSLIPAGQSQTRKQTDFMGPRVGWK